MIATTSQLENAMKEETKKSLRGAISFIVNEIESEKDLRIVYAFLKGFARKE